MPASTPDRIADAPALPSPESVLATESSSNSTLAWAREANLEMLAYEIARYQPELARQLVDSGRRKLLA